MTSQRRYLAPILAFFATAVGCSSTAEVANGGKIIITASGEGLGLEGFSFPPTPTQEAYFIDGWEMRFEHFYVSLGDITISADPDRSPHDRTVTGGPVTREIPLDQLRQIDPDLDSLCNTNTPEDYERALARIASEELQ